MNGYHYDDLLKKLIADGVSDVHFKVGKPPMVRLNGSLKHLKDAAMLQPEDTMNLAKHFLSPNVYERFTAELEADTSYSIKDVGRFRVNAFKQRGSISLILRVIPNNVPSFKSLGLPPVVEKLIDTPRGLILVTGVTGSGKSSTLAAMVDAINERYPLHIVTIEDPIEFLHKDKRGSINQREVGIDTNDFTTAFISSLRQDPDVIMVGELRDTKTMETALRASETGHLVLSTLHTSDAKETINRIVDFFPPHQQKQIRIQLAMNLNAVISQRLISRMDGKGRVPACEIMIVNAAIRDYILDPAKTGEIRINMAKGREQYGSQTFDQALIDLLKQGVITEKEALMNATSANDLKLQITTGTAGSSTGELISGGDFY
ncbi:MAG: PilT/PilU family type 4a pilus ATPase [Chitinispirillia bacterium]|nr:PilT/PilU family type 4a pilus ATPase [Chitinispirillia bacterium]MCL2269146.1 PilT/PilU family type 4a pilus ATPase [Chitinispirillia bacterium]